MSAFDKFLASLNPIGNAEAEPLMYGAPGYPYGNDTKAALALGHGASDEDIWKKFGLYKSPMANGGNALVGEVIDSGASLNPGKAKNIGDALNQRTYGLAMGANGDKEAPGAYTDSLGEEQARMTQVRALMTPEQRVNESPKTTIENMRKHGLNQFSVIQKLLENSANEK